MMKAAAAPSSALARKRPICQATGKVISGIIKTQMRPTSPRVEPESSRKISAGAMNDRLTFSETSA